MENGLPDDPLVDILSRLPAKSLCRFKCVSKPWRDLIADRLGCRNIPQTLQGFIYGDVCAFLTKLPEIEKIVLLGSCNGLVLFGHRRVSDVYDSLGYIVCNPATEQWVAVPTSGWCPWSDSEAEEDEEYLSQKDVLTYLIFDPAVSPHFQLVQLWQKNYARDLAGVHTYSSETGVWRPNEEEHFYCEQWESGVWRPNGEEDDWEGDWLQWGLEATISTGPGCPFNGRLHLKVDDLYERRSIIVAVDGDGKTSWIIRWTEERGFPDFVGHSRGQLYCMSGDIDDSDMITELSIWVLEDYHTEEWVLKHRVSILQLFGKMSCRFDSYEVAAIHPDCNLVFFVEYMDKKLISYDMDSKEAHDICTLGHSYGRIAPYVPYFLELSTLQNKH
ncbi:hypothetical protein ACP70R_014740 [Stipagrostis hirtigluma subsp. patula]